MNRTLYRSLALSTAPVLGFLLAANLCHAAAAPDPWTFLPKYQFGQSREPLATIEEQIRKSTADEKTGIESRLLEVLKAPSTSQDSRRFICRWLGTVGTEKSVTPLAALLSDPVLSHAARIALQALPYPAADKALTDALSKVKGNLLIGVISSLGARQTAGAVPELGKLLKDSDPAVVRAALSALGQIGTEPATKALASAKVPTGLERDLARAQVAAAFRMAEGGKRSEAAKVLQGLMNSAAQPTAIKGAAFQGLAATLPTKDAVTLIVNGLEDEDLLMRSAAVKAFATAGAARQAVAERLPNMKPAGQLLLLGILADAPEVAARRPILLLAESAGTPELKAAAIECLAVHGRAEDVPLVAKWAATGEEPVKAAARKTLQRMSGEGVDAALLRLVEGGDAGFRKAVMESLPGRQMQSAIPTLTRLVRGNDPVVAMDAAKALGLMGSTPQIQALAKVITTTQNNDLRSAAQEAIKTICTRAEDKAACAKIIQTELQNAARSEARAALLPLTLNVGGEEALAQVTRAMQDENAEVRGVAFRTLVAWPETRAASALLRFAQTNSQASQAIVALRDGCLRLAEMEEAPVTDRATILREVASLAQRQEEKRRAVSLMGQVPSPELLTTLIQLSSEASLRTEAIGSTVQLARLLAAVYPSQSLAALEQVGKLAETPELRTAVQNGIKAVRNSGQSPEGYLLGWMISGPYTAPDKDGAALFEIPFAPEKPAAQADWRPFTAPVNGIVNLDKIMPGNDRVAYMRATVLSEEDQKVRLELGSDDGVKVWLNGAVVHANNSVRPCAPGQDKVEVNLKKGDNLLLLKVSQGGGEWAAVARLVGTDGKPLTNLVVGASKR